MATFGEKRTDPRLRHAFISYVREDSRLVDWLQTNLEAAGVRVWRDTADLWPGQDWRKIIRRAIQDEALAFLACFSQQSLARPRSYQNEELILAIEELRKRQPDDPWLIPVRFSDCAVPALDIGAGRTLAWLQCADLFGDDADEGAARLVTTVLRILRPAADMPETTISNSGDAHLTDIKQQQGLASPVPAPQAGNENMAGPDRYQDEHEAWSRAAIRLNPADARVHLSLGNALNNQGRLIEAEAALREAMGLDPGNADVHASLGTTLNNAGRLVESEAACQQAIRLDPAYAWAHVILGAVLDHLRRFPDAEAACREAIRLGAVSAYAHAVLGGVLNHLGKWKEAEQSYREAIRLGPADASAHSGLGFALNNLGRLEEAEDCFREAIHLNSSNAP